MSELPETQEKPNVAKATVPMSSGSQVMGVSVRGWIAVLTILAVCVMGTLKIEVTEPLKSVVLVVATFYFAQKGKAGE